MARLKLKFNRLYLYITGYVLILSCLAFFGYIGVHQMEVTQEEKTRALHEDLPALASNKAFYGLPRMDLTLSSFEGQTHHARISISLEIEKKNMERFIDFQPRVSDRIISYLRRQNIDEIRKPEAMYDLRHDLLQEINQASGPVPVDDIIFREFVVR